LRPGDTDPDEISSGAAVTGGPPAPVPCSPIPPQEDVMKKLRLVLDDIRVDSFDVTRERAERGTVRGHVCCCGCVPCCCTGGDSCGGSCDTCVTGCGTCYTNCGSCAGQYSCDYSCGGSCGDYTCDPYNCPSGYQIICQDIQMPY
jgi:hypothetical protein